MQAYGLIIAVFVNICSKETNRQAKAGGKRGGGEVVVRGVGVCRSPFKDQELFSLFFSFIFLFFSFFFTTHLPQR